ncbi:MAG TPA: alanine--tRNA ligase [Thermoanaerobaculia bacterium]|nr:alanine--tRNA ligase [Thermoanaerobaculia bacterium]
MKSAEIRSSFLDFFAARGHRVQPSAPLVPHGDPTLLFTNAGMVPFKNAFLGVEPPPAPRAASVQKCLRVSGKHNDLENVGPSPRHHTFFEMLGNFSFGDYFKEEAIRSAWELVTEVWGLPPDRLAATVYEEDDEAHALWLRLSSLPPERVRRCGAADNFWAMGETGPCGPCSEIFVDLQSDRPPLPWDEGTESGRYLEIWNLVFMQYERDATGALAPLPKPSIDTGAGLERVSAVLQNVDSNYDTDLFHPILAAAADLARTRYGADAERDVSLRVIADHLRAVTFLLADGVIPGNEGRGYVLRRLLRRAVRHGMRVGFEEPFLHRLVPVLEQVMGGAYPELAATREASTATIRVEEEKFLGTLAVGARQVQEEIERARGTGAPVLPGEAVFRLYDTYGLPLEVIAEIAEEERMEVDRDGFERALGAQREQSRAATGDTQRRMRALQEALREAGELPPTSFVGYATLEETARVLRVVALPDDPRTRVVVTDRTPFYAESGGQVGDRGDILWAGGEADVLDAQKSAGVTYHFVRRREGDLAEGVEVRLRVDPAHRIPTQRNHTATHLLHAVLRTVLGDHVRQAGSLVAPDRLRFDFTYPEPLSDEQRRVVEEMVNRWVLRAVPTAISERSYQEALAAGAMALFGEKYGDRVRTVEVPGFSLELCGGCHVRNTGEIGPFVILHERGIASGVRRIEALTGEGALAWLRERDSGLAAVEARLGVAGARAEEEVRALQKQVKDREAELARLRLQLVAGAPGAGAAEEGTEVDGVRVVAREVPPAPANELRNLADALRSKLGSGVVVLGSRDDGNVSLVAAVSKDLAGRVHAGELVKRVAALVGGAGGGRPDFAQAGGKAPEKLPEALAAVAEAVRGQLAK